MEEEELSLARLLDALDWRVVLLGIGIEVGVVFSLDIVFVINKKNKFQKSNGLTCTLYTRVQTLYTQPKGNTRNTANTNVTLFTCYVSIPC